jgi:hypothetical protein
MRSIVVGVLVLLGGCAAPRRASVSGLSSFPGTLRVVVTADGEGDPALQAALVEGATRGLGEGRRLNPTPIADAETFQLAMHVTHLHAPQSVAPPSSGPLPVHLSLPGEAPPQGDLAVQAELVAPDGVQVGTGQWIQRGAPELQAPLSGAALARAFDAAAVHDWSWVPRRASDERLFLTPTALLLLPGEVELSDDELLGLRLAVGLGRRVQLDFFGGVVPVPFAGAGGLPVPGAIIGGAGAGLGAAGALDVGLKFSLLDEAAYRPAISLAYDLLDVNASAIGVGVGGAAGGGGGAAGGGVGVGTANAQFNVFTAALTKHFGGGTLTLGSYLIDNHHFLPQSANFAGVVGIAGSNGETQTGGTSGGKLFSRVPTQVQPFASYMQIIGPHSAMAVEVFPWAPLRPVFATTGLRWVLGRAEPVGGVPVDRIRLRIDAALVWLYAKGDPKQRTHDAVGGLPWLGVGLDFL